MIAGLFAVDSAGGMGNNGSMPWPTVKEDMRWFKRVTENQIVVMGKKSWHSPDMPKPLPNRINVVVSNHDIGRDDVMRISGDLVEALKLLANTRIDKTIFVIGGADTLMQAKPVLDKIYITRIPGEYISDTVIDLNKLLDGFELETVVNLETCKVEQYAAI